MGIVTAQKSMVERDLDATKRDRFELLSAYLDGEVTPEERQLIQGWLTTDPAVKGLYQRLLHLRQGFQTLPCQADDTESVLSQVVCALNRRLRLACMASTGVCILGALGMLSGVFSPRYSLMQWATVPAETGESSYGTLQVSLDEPVFALPSGIQAVPQGEPLAPGNSDL